MYHYCTRCLGVHLNHSLSASRRVSWCSINVLLITGHQSKQTRVRVMEVPVLGLLVSAVSYEVAGPGVLSLSLCFLPWKWSRSSSALTLSHHLGQAASSPAGHPSLGQVGQWVAQCRCKHNYQSEQTITYSLTPALSCLCQINSYFLIWHNNIVIGSENLRDRDYYSFIFWLNKDRWKNSKTF